MSVGAYLSWMIQGSHSYEPKPGTPSIIAPHSHLAFAAAINVMGSFTLRCHRNTFERTFQFLKVLGFNDRIDDKGAAGLILAICAMATIHKHRRRQKPISNRAAETSAFQFLPHVSLSRSRGSFLVTGHRTWPGAMSLNHSFAMSSTVERTKQELPRDKLQLQSIS